MVGKGYVNVHNQGRVNAGGRGGIMWVRRDYKSHPYTSFIQHHADHANTLLYNNTPHTSLIHP